VAHGTLASLYRESTVFVAPSVVAAGGDQEGLGLVFAEAMACECPVVAFDLPAIRDLVEDGITGLLAREKDSHDLAMKILHLLDHPEERTRIAQSGRRHVAERFDWDVVATRYAALIQDLAEQTQGS
jgi:glycosyltransferase involved in cell wall biosynthesis